MEERTYARQRAFVWDKPTDLGIAQGILSQRQRSLYYAVWTQRNWTRRMTNRLLEVQKDLNYRLVQLGCDPLRLLRRERWREFVVRTVRYMSEGKDRLEAGKLAAKQTFSGKFGHEWKDESLTRFTRNILQKPEVCVAIEVLFERAGLAPADAARIHIDHIRGIGSGDGTLAPNYKALKDYWDMTMPRQPAKLDVTDTHYLGGVHPLDQTPVIDARLFDEEEEKEQAEQGEDDAGPRPLDPGPEISDNGQPSSSDDTGAACDSQDASAQSGPTSTGDGPQPDNS